MLLRGMHDTGCDEIYIIVTDLKKQEMDDVTEYFKMVSPYCFGRRCKPSIENQIQYARSYMHEKSCFFYRLRLTTIFER